MTISFMLNGVQCITEAQAETPLLYVLRNDFALKGAKYGCGLGQCGACCVVINGQSVPSCVVKLADVLGGSVETIEGISASGRLHPLQQAFLAEQAAQCGFCTAGVIMAAKALLDATPDPTDAQIKQALKLNLCRCGTYPRILKAVLQAAREMKR